MYEFRAQATTKKFTAAKGTVLLWLCGVLWVYRGLAYPHAAYIFHLHTVAAALFIVLLVFATASALEARKKTQLRPAKLASHRLGMFGVIGLSALTAMLMVYKKTASGNGLLLLDRTPSLHSGAALAWTALEVALAVSGAIVYINRSGDPPPAAARALATGVFGTVGKARKALKPLHRIIGLVATTLAMSVAILGMTEKSSWDAQPERFILAAILALVWALLWLPALCQ